MMEGAVAKRATSNRKITDIHMYVCMYASNNYKIKCNANLA